MQLLIHPFKVDVTPPIGDYLCGGLHPKATAQETPLYLRGLILATAEARYVLACVDYCYLAGQSQTRFVEALAKAAAVPPEMVALHSNHVHDAPLIDEEAAALLREQIPDLYNEEYFAGVLENSAAGVKAALQTEGIEVTGVSFASHEVKEFGSSRRVPMPDGTIGVRWSFCADEAVRNAPEGKIDPLLDQIAFYDAEGNPRICLNFYASHPQVSDGRGIISSDTVGGALALFEAEHPDIFSIYFTGCAGDVTAGKYSTRDKVWNQRTFSQRLFEGMSGAFAKHHPKPLQSVGWTDLTFNLPLKPVEITREACLAEIEDPKQNVGMKYLAAMKLDRLNRSINEYPFRISRLKFNELGVLLMPSELLVHYQFHAKAQANGPLAVAAYGDSFLKYVPHDAAFDEGGYEVEPMWSEVEKGIEPLICAGIDQVLSRDI